MVIIELAYKQPLQEVDRYLTQHREFLQAQYDKGLLLASGPKNPRSGGIIVALQSIDKVRQMIEKDPFNIHDIADYKLTEFEAVKFHQLLAEIIQDNW